MDEDDEDVPLGALLRNATSETAVPVAPSAPAKRVLPIAPRTNTARCRSRIKVESSESGSDSSAAEEDDDEEEEEEQPCKRTRKSSVSSPSSLRSSITRRGPSTRASKSQREDDSDAEDEDGEQAGQVLVSLRASQRDQKMNLVAQVLSRWWYVLPPWPPEDFDYSKALRQQKYRQVEFDQWEEADDVDADGFTKLYEISNFPGLYRDPKGTAIDMRPKEGKPCYSSLSALSDLEVAEMAVIAFTNQIKALENSPYTETEDEQHKELGNRLKASLKTVTSQRDTLLRQHNRKYA